MWIKNVDFKKGLTNVDFKSRFKKWITNVDYKCGRKWMIHVDYKFGL